MKLSWGGGTEFETDPLILSESHDVALALMMTIRCLEAQWHGDRARSSSAIPSTVPREVK